MLKLSQSEVIGSCVFNLSPTSINSTNFSYLLSFSDVVNSAGVMAQSISNLGDGGSTSLLWSIEDCGDNKNFKIEPTTIVGDGTITPDVSNIITALSTSGKIVELESSISQTTVNFDTAAPSVIINQSSLETVGSCNFTGTNDPTNVAGFSYRVAFSEKVIPSTFTVSDITNSGTGGGTSLVWTLESCGDNQNFKLVVNSLVGDGTIIPSISSGVLTDLAGNTNTVSTSVDNSITYDTSSLLVNVNQSTSETIGTCSFGATTDPMNFAGFSYKIVFSRNIDASSFVIGDITNSGTSGNIGWSLASCGDGLTYKLVADTIEFNGTVIPTLLSSVVLDSFGIVNQASTAVDNSITFDNVRPGVTINQAITETVGSCSFTAATDPASSSGFSYRVNFSEAIDPTSFITSDISNVGTGGSTTLTWQLDNCGDNQNYKLTASSVVGDGTIIPRIVANQVFDAAGNLNTLSTATDNSVTFDPTSPSVTINQSITQTVGSCSFVSANDPTNSSGFSYRINFSEAIDATSFIISDISNIGTGGSTTLTWQLDNCGDNQNYKLTASSVVGDGTIIPRIAANQVFDLAGNLNTLSTATDNTVTFDTASASVVINQSSAETVGSCSFLATSDPTNAVGFSYKVSFSEVINAGTFTVADIANTGSGGGTTLTWSLASCGDNQNFKLTASAVVGNGTIIPNVSASSVSDVAGNLNTLSTSTDNSITYDTVAPNVTINRSVLETVGSCSFVATSANESAAGFSFKVAFSEKINNSSFIVTDVTNGGTGGATTLTWTIVNCGDDQNYQLTASAISGEGTIIPQLLASKVTDVAGNQNALYTSVNGTVNYEVAGWKQEAYIKASNSEASDWFGYNISLSGDTLVVAARNEDSDATAITNGTGSSATNTKSNSGAVYIYKRTGNNWAQEAYVKASNSDIDDKFGYSVSVSGDTIVVTANEEDSTSIVIINGAGSDTTNTKSNSGAAYVYKRTGSSWAQEAFIKASNSGTNDKFGSSVSISGDTIAVGAQDENSSATTITNGTGFSEPGISGNSGAVYVYKRIGSSWAQEAFIKAINNGISDYLGYSLSLSGDTLAVGAYGEDSAATTITNGTSVSDFGSSSASGAVYVYKRTGNIWAQEAYIKASNAGTTDTFGIALSLNGHTLAVGANSEDSDATVITNGAGFSGADLSSNSGTVYVYKRTGNSWAQEAYIKASNNGAGDLFGGNVSVSGDTIAVGANSEDSSATTITNDSGFSEPGTGTDSGAVYVYKRSGTNWVQEAYVKASNNGSTDKFGSSVSLSGDTLAVGAYTEDSNDIVITNGVGASATNGKTDSGAVYVYRNNARLFNTQDVFTTSISTTSLTLNWSKSGFKTTGYFIAYAVGFNAPVDCSSGTVIDVGNNTSYVFNSLTPGTHYSFRICSYDSSANLSSGYVITFHTSSALPEPGDLSAVTNSDRAITLNWGSAGGSVTGYRLVYQQGTAAPLTCNDGTSINVGNVLTYQLTGLLTNTDYGVRVCSYDGSANLSFGKYLSVKTDLTPNPINAYMTSTALTNDTLTVYWTYAGDRVTGFKIAWDLGSIAPATCSAGTVIDVGNVTSYSISGLTAGAAYAIRICAYEIGGINASTGIILVGGVRNSGWVQEAYIKASNGETNDYFGFSVSLSGDTVAVGAYQEDSDATTITNGSGVSDTGVNSNSGAVYIYKRSGISWAQEAYIKAVNSEAGDNFGYSVSLSGDTLAVGANFEDSDATTITNGSGFSEPGTSSNSGAVYIYKRTGNNWAQEAYVKASNSGSSDYFGYSISLSGDSLAVSAPNEDSNATTITNGSSFSDAGTSLESGVVYIYKRTGAIWAQEAYVKASNNGTLDYFGNNVSLSGDSLAVGAYGEDSDATTITNGSGFSDSGTSSDSGAVYVYKRTGAIWAQEAYIKASNNGSGDYFGYSVSLSGDTLAVGAYNEDSDAITITNGAGFSDSGTSSDSGAVYVYQRSGSIWAQEAYVKASNNGSGDNLGKSVSVSGDSLAVGAHQEDSNATTITNGSGFSDSGSTLNSGAVYVYKRTGSNWAQEAYVKAVNNGSSDNFGNVISTSGDSLAVGAYFEDSTATTVTNGVGFSEPGATINSGAVYIYRNNARLFTVTEIFPVITSNSISLKWHKTGGTAAGYGVNIEFGIVTPTLCSVSMDYDLGDNNQVLINSLTADTDYSLRICVYDSSNQFVEDKVINLKTNP